MNKQKTKKLRGIYILDIAIALIATILVVFGIWRSLNPKDQPLCANPGQEHQLELRGDEFSQKDLSLNQCDVIKIVNFDNQNYQLAFGVHDKHVDYPGFSEQLIRSNEFIVLYSVQAGDFRIHDHLRDKAAVDLSIKAKD